LGTRMHIMKQLLFPLIGLAYFHPAFGHIGLHKGCKSEGWRSCRPERSRADTVPPEYGYTDPEAGDKRSEDSEVNDGPRRPHNKAHPGADVESADDQEAGLTEQQTL
ncbi:hypothetical protein XENOCAPTIV_022157, partial [Xenoophorus captivus]